LNTNLNNNKDVSIQTDLFGSVATYATSNSALAAWLYYSGYEILTVKSESPHIKSLIFRTSEELRKHVMLWQTGKAEGNCSQYEAARKSVLRMVNNENS
jgi:hypothetical protein